MSIHKKSERVFEIRWRQGGRHKSVLVHGGHELARKVEGRKCPFEMKIVTLISNGK